MATADRCLPTTGQARIINTRDWLDNVNRVPIRDNGAGVTVPMVIDSTGNQYLGTHPTQMEIDSTGSQYLGPKPMQIDSTGSRYMGAKPMQGVAYQCRKCRRQFDHKEDLSRHYNRHPTHR